MELSALPEFSGVRRSPDVAQRHLRQRGVKSREFYQP
jgi:hypothetical protein